MIYRAQITFISSALKEITTTGRPLQSQTAWANADATGVILCLTNFFRSRIALRKDSRPGRGRREKERGSSFFPAHSATTSRRPRGMPVQKQGGMARDLNAETLASLSSLFSSQKYHSDHQQQQQHCDRPSGKRPYTSRGGISGGRLEVFQSF